MTNFDSVLKMANCVLFPALARLKFGNTAISTPFTASITTNQNKRYIELTFNWQKFDFPKREGN